MENEKRFYVYKWYNVDTNEVFYVGKGCRNRSGQISQRNNIFKEYYNTHNCKSEIIEYFTDEQEALKREHELIQEYKNQGQVIANLDEGGRGGLSFVWTEEMREYKSKYNPMKEAEQRKRMIENNPMNNPEIAAKVRLKNLRPVIINNIEYAGVSVAAKYFNVNDSTVCSWCSRGYDTNGNPCRYKDEVQKEVPFIKTLGHNVSNIRAVEIDGIYYPTVKAGAEAIGGNSSNLIRAIQANRTYKGHTCNYTNQQPS